MVLHMLNPILLNYGYVRLFFFQSYPRVMKLIERSTIANTGNTNFGLSFELKSNPILIWLLLLCTYMKMDRKSRIILEVIANKFLSSIECIVKTEPTTYIQICIITNILFTINADLLGLRPNQFNGVFMTQTVSAVHERPKRPTTCTHLLWMHMYVCVCIRLFVSMNNFVPIKWQSTC